MKEPVYLTTLVEKNKIENRDKDDREKQGKQSEYCRI